MKQEIKKILVLSSVKSNQLTEEDDIWPLQVSSDGSVNWDPPSTFDIPCNAEYKHYPFDSHNCSIVFSSWTYSGSEILLETLDINMDKNFAGGTAWILSNVTHNNEILTPEKGSFKFHFVRVNMYLKRTSTIYRFLCVIPTMIVFISSMSGKYLLNICKTEGKEEIF
ncbi:neuronal acetylcholine receptor subunit non-alpha-3 [Trichonephila clavipes]|nr:neuronal acetylcholine receptor subunit non-alpha-3 [Trichonephila clavipes]